MGAALSVIAVAATTAVAAASPPGDLTGYGALGILAAASLAGAVIVYRDLRKQIAEANARADRMVAEANERADRMILAANARADRIDAERNELSKDIMKDVLPVLTEAIVVVSGSKVELQRRGSR